MAESFILLLVYPQEKNREFTVATSRLYDGRKTDAPLRRLNATEN